MGDFLIIMMTVAILTTELISYEIYVEFECILLLFKFYVLLFELFFLQCSQLLKGLAIVSSVIEGINNKLFLGYFLAKYALLATGART